MREPNHGFLIYLFGIASGVMFAVCVLFNFQIGPETSNVEMKYADLVTVLLTAISVILTTLGLFIGVLAVWGYSQFQKMTRVASAEHLEKMLQAGKFKSEVEDLIVKHVSAQLVDGDLRRILAERVDRMLLDDAQRREGQSAPTSGDEPFRG